MDASLPLDKGRDGLNSVSQEFCQALSSLTSNLKNDRQWNESG
jgi:hypothetical protein